MNIDHSPTNDSLDKSQTIKDVAQKIISYLSTRISEINNSIYAERPDENGNYPKSYYEEKDRRDQLNQFMQIFLSTAEEMQDDDSIESFISKSCNQIQNFPESSYKQLFKFIEKKLRIKIKLQSGPTTFYIQWTKYWADKYHAKIEEIQEIVPFENFDDDDTATRVRKVMAHFNDLD